MALKKITHSGQFPGTLYPGKRLFCVIITWYFFVAANSLKLDSCVFFAECASYSSKAPSLKKHIHRLLSWHAFWNLCKTCVVSVCYPCPQVSERRRGRAYTEREKGELCVPWQDDERLEFDHSSFSDHSLFCSTL